MATETVDKTINDWLPEEILMKSLEYLQKEDLLSATQVCKMWNEVISSNQSTMKHLPLVLTNDLTSSEAYEEVMNFKRKYYKIVIRVIGPTDVAEKFIAIAAKHSSTVRQIFYDAAMLERDSFVFDVFLPTIEILSQLEKVSIDDGFLRIDFRPENTKQLELFMNRVNSKNLKKLVIRDSNMLPALNTSGVKSIKVKSSALTFTQPQDLSSVEELALKVNGEIPFESFHCPLKQLAVFNDIGELMIDNFENTLEKLEINGVVTSNTLVTVFKKLRKLQVFKLSASRLPSREDYQEHLLPNPSVNVLILKKLQFSLSNIEPCIGNLPNVQSLVLQSGAALTNDGINQLMTFISINLIKLRLLEVDSLLNNAFTNVSISSLREFHIHLYAHESKFTRDGLTALTLSCPNIEKLIIESIHDSLELSANDILMIVTNLRKLQSLYIGPGFIATREAFDHLKTCQELKSVTMMKNATDNDPTMIDDFVKNGPPLVLLEKGATDIRLDFNLWKDDDFKVLSDGSDIDVDEDDLNVDYDDFDFEERRGAFDFEEFGGGCRPG